MNVECLRESIHVQTNMGRINTSTMGNEMSHSYFSSSHTWGCIYDVYLSDFTGIHKSLPQIFHFPLSKTNKQKNISLCRLYRQHSSCEHMGNGDPILNQASPTLAFTTVSWLARWEASGNLFCPVHPSSSVVSTVSLQVFLLKREKLSEHGMG